MLCPSKAGHGPRTGLGYSFDATLGYPGEGPSHSPPLRRCSRPSLRLWSTKRPHAMDPLRVRLEFSASAVDPLPSKTVHGNSDTRLGQWLHNARTTTQCGSDAPHRTGPDQAHRSTIALDSSSGRRTETPASSTVGIQPIEGALHRGTAAPALISRRDFIRKFALQHGVSHASLEAIWRSNKRGYNAAYDAPFGKFQQFFRTRKPGCPFSHQSILPGDLVAFLQQEHDAGAAYASLKDASASISMACREATDGEVALGDRESVKRFLKSIRIHEPVGHRKQIVPAYHDVSALIQEAWDFGPNEGLC